MTAGIRLVLLGPPGAGKGTQALLLSAAFRIPHVSTGDILREHKRLGTPLGAEAATYMDRGELVPDNLVIRMLVERLGHDDAAGGFLLDGFPRTVPQALALEGVLAEQDWPLTAVLRFVVADVELVRRLDQRRDLEGRADDDPEVVRNRLDVFRQQTEPLEFFYLERGLVRDVDAVGGVEQVTKRALAALDVAEAP